MEAAAAADHPGDNEDKERRADGDLEEGDGGDQDDVQLLGRGPLAV